MKVYTKKGDSGKTSILGASNLDKDDLRIQAYGTVDELNSFVGELNALVSDLAYTGELTTIQNTLFCLGSELASTAEAFGKLKMERIEPDDISMIESWIDKQTDQLPALSAFVLPGGSRENAIAHQCRTICRRAERNCVTLSKEIDVRPEVIQYLNRLSDYFFTLARTLTQERKAVEITWKGKKV